MKNAFFILLILFFFINFSFSEISPVDKPEKGRWDLDLKKIWEADSAGEQVFGEVQNIRSADNGNIYIADTKNKIIFILDNNGKFKGSFGKKGEGPGELREYYGGDQLHIADNKIIFTDRSLIHYFDLNGKYLFTKNFSPSLRPRLFITGTSFISAPVTVDSRSPSKAKIAVFDMKSGKEKVLKYFKPFEKATDTQNRGGRQVTVGIVVGGITPMMIINQKDGKIYAGMSNTYKIDIFSTTGEKLGILGVEGRKTKKVSDKYKKRLKNSLGEVPANMLKNIIDGLPANASFFQNIEIDDNGYVYVMLSDPDNRSGGEIDIYSPDGRYIYRAVIDLGEDLNIQILYMNNDLMIAAVEDEDGNVMIVKYRIALPSK